MLTGVIRGLIASFVGLGFLILTLFGLILLAYIAGVVIMGFKAIFGF